MDPKLVEVAHFILVGWVEDLWLAVSSLLDLPPEVAVRCGALSHPWVFMEWTHWLITMPPALRDTFALRFCWRRRYVIQPCRHLANLPFFNAIAEPLRRLFAPRAGHFDGAGQAQ